MDLSEAERLIRLAIQKGLLDEVTVQALRKDLSKEAQKATTICVNSAAPSDLEAPPIDTQKISLEEACTLHLTEEVNSLRSVATIKTDLQSEAVPSRPSQQRVLQLKQVGRYEVLKLLGEGGMGSVYQAYDPVLKRYVALKFIRENDPELVKRLLLEGRAQAKIEHPHVCKVYEVGELDGQFFIAMQYIAGKTLNKMMKEMTLEQKVKVMTEVAEALHAAHKEGLIHRDIKPQNIIVEETADGMWKPYVMDFGLVREASTKGMTVTGAVLGTPWYMAPEQARGETNKLDRRTDVYSLGATLYELLVGQVPFEGGTAEVLMKVLQEEAPTLRRIDPRIPADLETIVMKCLEKEPQQRYDSAKALQEDLLRYLAGEPIAGRRAGWFYRVGKKIRKHKAMAAMMAITIAIAFVLAGMGWQARRQAERRSVLVRQFGEQVREIEDIMRHGHMLPLHDIGREEEMVKERMLEVSESMKKLGELGEGPGHYALGRGYEELKDYEHAKEQLEQAWAKGYREPEAAYALGLVLDVFYQKRLEEVEQIDNKDLRELERQKAEIELKKPALKYLELGLQAKVESSEYGEALMAYYDKHWEEAIKKADAAIKKIPWLYEAKQLTGDVYFAIGNEERDKGDYEKAQRAYQAAQAAYKQAMEIGTADAETYKSLAKVWIEVAKLDLNTGTFIQDAFKQALEACDQTLEVNPRQGESYVQKAEGYLSLGQYRSEHGEEPLEQYERAIQEVQKALLAPMSKSQTASAYIVLGNAYYKQGDYQVDKGEDPKSAFDLAIESYRKALEFSSNDAVAYDGIGRTYLSEGEYERIRGENPSMALDKAIESYRKTLQINTNYAPAYKTIGTAYLTKGEYQSSHGENPTTAFDQAIESYRKALQINPKYAQVYNNRGIAYRNKADYQLEHGEDPTTALDQAIENYHKAIQIKPNDSIAYNNMGFAYLAKGGYQLGQGENPTAALEQAIESCRKALQIKPNSAFTYSNLGFAYLIKGRYQLSRGQDPLSVLQQSLAALKGAQRLDPTDFLLYQIGGKVHLLLAQWTIERNQTPKNSLESARAALEKAIELKPDEAENYRAMGEWHRWQAEWQLRKGGKPKNEIEQGLEMVQKALANNPDMAQAYASQGMLYLLAARMEKDPNRRVQVARQARQTLEKAISINALLEHDCRPLLNEAQAISHSKAF